MLINAFGSEARMLLTCGVQARADLERLVEDFLQQIERPRATWREKLGALPMLGRIARLFPRYRASGPCQDVVHEGADVDLDELPVLTTWPEDGGPTITLGLVFTKDPETGARNCGMYRLQRYDGRTLGFHVHTHHTGADHLRKARALGREHLDVAIAVGASAKRSHRGRWFPESLAPTVIKRRSSNTAWSSGFSVPPPESGLIQTNNP